MQAAVHPPEVERERGESESGSEALFTLISRSPERGGVKEEIINSIIVYFCILYIVYNIAIVYFISSFFNFNFCLCFIKYKI